ncbi:MAG: hypothetical protein AABY34_06955 [Pseudomonadota bacterium]
MLEIALKEFSERTREIEREGLALKMEMSHLRAEMSKNFNRHTLAIITILGSMMALFAFVEHFLH